MALENRITKSVAKELQGSYVVEEANGPTAEYADSIIEERNIKLIPNIFSNSGGVIVSYFESVQNI